MTLELYYPTNNRIGVRPNWKWRDLKIIETVDLMDRPIPPLEFLKRPLVRRGRFLLRAWDRQGKQYRQFYENCFKHCFREVPLRVGVFSNEKVEPVTRSFLPEREEIKELTMILHGIKHLDVFVYSDDLKVIGG